MNRRIYTLALAATMAFAQSAISANYYVSKSGDDNNSGKESAPFLTIAKASSIMEAGDNCIIKEGVYNETIESKQSGTQRKAITYTNFEDDRVVISATEVVDGWKHHAGNIYKVRHALSASEAIYNTLFYKGEAFDIARWPNNADDDRFSFDGHRIDGGSGSHFEVSGLPECDLSGGYFCYLGAHSGTSWSRKIESHKGGEIHFKGVDIKKWPYTPHNPTVLRNKNRGQLYVYGVMGLLDHEREWFYDAAEQTIYAIFPEGKAPEAGSVECGVRRTTVEINHDYINLDGLECFGGELRIKGSGCRVENGKYINCSQTLEGLIGISAQSSTGTIVIKGNDIVIENNLIEGGYATGVSVQSGKDGHNYLIRNNVIRYFNSIGIHANGIRSGGSETTITNNTIYTCGRDAIVTSGHNCEIAYNDLYDCMKINNDGGVFYTVGNDNLKNTKIHHNYCHDSYGPEYADGRAAGIYLDNNSKGYEVYNNVIWNVTWSALMFNWYNTDLHFYNNTIWDCGFNMGRWENGYSMERIIVKNNFANVTSRDKIEKKGEEEEWISTEKEANIIDDKSPFIAVEKRDFRPAAGSAVVGAGVTIEKFTPKMKRGAKPDVGAYRLGEELWSVGASWAEEVAPKVSTLGTKRKHTATESEDDIFGTKNRKK